MNYLKLINDFWVLHEQFCFTPNETMLYFALLNSANRFNWKQNFTQSNGYLANQCGISEPTLIRARNTLKQKGLIDFSSEKGRRNITKYVVLDVFDNKKNKNKNLNNLSNSVRFSLSNSVRFSDENSLDIIKHNNNSNTINKFFFAQIKNLSESIKNFEGHQGYFFIAYRFWELWDKTNPNSQTLKNAEAYAWSDEIRKLLTLDKVTPDRLIAIYTYFSECANETAGFRDFWFKTIKSTAGLRKKNKNGEYNIDRIADEVNEQLEKNEEFKQKVISNIEKYKKHYAEKP